MTHRLKDLLCASRSIRGERVRRPTVSLTDLADRLVSMTGNPGRQATAFFVPGRIEVLGKHTDYAGGRSLVTATEQGLYMLGCARTDSVIRIVDLARSEQIEFVADMTAAAAGSGWEVYPRAVAQRLVQVVGERSIGADIVFTNTLPSSAGLSSSSALVVATFLTLFGCHRWEHEPRLAAVRSSREDLAAFLGAVENGRPFGEFESTRGVGTRGGDQDHTAILCARRGEIRQFRFLPTIRERSLKLPSGYLFAIAHCGVEASKTGDAQDDYNRVSELAGSLEELWEATGGAAGETLGSIVSGGRGRVEKLLTALDHSGVGINERESLRQRLTQFYRETEEIIPAAAEALQRGDLRAFGDHVEESMRLAIENLGNQIEETVWLSAAARDLGAAAASAFGAGFGGAVWALVRSIDSERFLQQWRSDYLGRFPGHEGKARFMATVAGGPATEL